MELYSYITVFSRFNFYDVHVQEITLFYDDDENHTLDFTTADSSDWGSPSRLVMKSPETYPLPNRIKLRWITPIEGKCFELDETLNQAKDEKLWEKLQQDFPDDCFRQYIIGVAPYGYVAIWISSNEKSVLLHLLMAHETQLNEKESMIYFPDPEMDGFIDSLLSLEKLQSHMRQYRYRFVPLEEYFDEDKWRKYDSTSIYYEATELEGVEVKCLDGTFDYTDSDNLLRYHEAGKPCRITVKWKEGGAVFLSHFWLDETEVTFFYDGFFNTFPDAQADLLLRIDTRADRYEIAMTGKGLPIRTLQYTQYIVMRDYVEISRSTNYRKKDGEWRWLS